MRHIVRINQCLSGALSGRSSKYHNILLATPFAMKRFFDRPEVQKAVSGIQDPRHQSSPVFDQAGLVKEVFVNARDEVSVGLRSTEPLARETKIYQEARQELVSLARGVHRRVVLGYMGLVAERAIEQLPDNQFSALLAEIEQRFKDPTIATIEELRVSNAAFHSIKEGTRGKILTLSRAMLDNAACWSNLATI